MSLVAIAKATVVLGTVLAAGCALSSASLVRFSPMSGDRSAAPFTTELVRSCALDDCRTQAVQMRLPDGELMAGQLRFLAGGALSTDAALGGVVGVGSPVVPSQERRPAVMTLTGDHGSRMQCELFFSTGARHATGQCRAASGVAYAVSF